MYEMYFSIFTVQIKVDNYDFNIKLLILISKQLNVQKKKQYFLPIVLNRGLFYAH